MSSGARFAGYTIVRLLGSGRTGQVYLAEHPRLSRRVALKILTAAVSADTEFRERFAVEADLAAALRHPHIVEVHDRGQYQRQLWISMDYVDGPNISRLLQQHYPAGMPILKVLKVVTAVAAALDYARDRGLLHGGVIPSNILLTRPRGGLGRILLTDFGLSRRLDDLGGPTAADVTVETLAYAAPEQFTGSSLDGRVDQYALAATTYHLLTGSPPFEYSSAAEVISHHLSAAPPRLRHLRPELAALEGALSQALSKDPDERFGSCSDFADALTADAHNQQLQNTTPPPTPEAAQDQSPSRRNATHCLSTRAWRHRSRPRSATIAIKILAVTLVASAVVGGVQLARDRHAFLSAAPQSAQSPTPAPVSASAQGSGPVPPAPPPPSCGNRSALLPSMSTRDKLAQLLMVGVTGAADARAVVANQHVGGIFIGSWTDLSMLTDGSLTDIANSAGPLPLAVSVDEEGGRVQRLSSLIGSSPSARVLAQTDTPEQVYQLALDRGRKMRNLGITIDFAPDVDVTNAPADTVIGDRSFAADPAVVTIYAGEYARGLRDAGLLPVLKHFPGHGRASGDSHAGGVGTPPLDDLRNVDLLPYRTLVTQGPVGVMIGHLQVPALTGSDPASLSPAAVGLLRNGGGSGGPPFNGPVFTDDLSGMKAISGRFGVADAVLKALQAGADTALWITTSEVPAVLDRLESAVAGGELTMAGVNASVLRMAAAKGSNPRCGH
jgi:beta-glucosidase-like glycosyl hydrolase/serine/threonine protein kinase